MEAVVLQNLVKKYQQVTAIDDISITVAGEQIFGFLGPDGAGKTSLLQILCGILTATAGKVSVLGIDVLNYPERLKQELGYMAQKFALYTDLTVKENLDFFADLFNTPLRGLTRRKQELLRFAGLTQFQDRLAGNLSGGMKQKLALCCTLIHTPRILILDEPTTGVDPVSRQEFWEMLTPLPEQGTTVIISTAYMDEAAKCDRVAMMNLGKILRSGTPAELKKALEGKIYEVTGERLIEIHDLLLNSVKDVQLYGDCLHVQLKSEMAFDSEQGRMWLKTVLGENGFTVTVKLIEPSLGDVFFQLLTEVES
ncbi:MAG: ATP-binding cassette domain-containing protein [Bacteroidota bacterium]